MSTIPNGREAMTKRPTLDRELRVKVSGDTVDTLTRIAQYRGLTLSALVRTVLIEYGRQHHEEAEAAQ
jgi:hypothetical protein